MDKERKKERKKGAPKFSSSLIVWISNGISTLGTLFPLSLSIPSFVDHRRHALSHQHRTQETHCESTVPCTRSLLFCVPAAFHSSTKAPPSLPSLLPIHTQQFVTGDCCSFVKKKNSGICCWGNLRDLFVCLGFGFWGDWRLVLGFNGNDGSL